jgi:prolyl-tRNA editing enzyme YbaK/EbsC (Cys-tRNA(Pro) deacylase)
MSEIRFKISEKLDELISKVSKDLGVDKADYVKTLILNDLRKGEAKLKK